MEVIMILDLDTRKLAPFLKKGDMFMFDGQKLVAINKEEMLKPLIDEIKKHTTAIDNVQNLLGKTDAFIRALGKRVLGEEK